jgi:ATP-binding cassette subfamily B protein
VAVLISFGPWLPALLFLAALPVMYVVSTHALAYQRWRRRTTESERRTWYYDFVLSSADHAAELRGFDAGRRFQTAHRLLRAQLREEHLNLLWRGRITEAGATAASTLVMGALVVSMAWRAVQGLITLGQLAAFYSAFAWGLATVRSVLTSIARIHSNALFIEGLSEFLALEPRVVSPREPIHVPLRVQEGIAFRNVTFRYPGATRNALEGFTLHLKAGQTAAIVGPNGAGKSTLIKLICRLYDPLEGTIEIDGIDIRRFHLHDLRNLIAALFQPPVRYFESVDQNIRLGPASETLSRLDVRRATDAAGASPFIERLPQGYDTPLGKVFAEGTELSAGEWQRLALARTLARPSQIVLLDEPTSALDPWAEGDWYTRFRGAVADRTVIINTHRLVTAKQADVIHVMENGRIVESGCHDDLMTRGGRYAACAAATRETAFVPLELATR